VSITLGPHVDSGQKEVNPLKPSIHPQYNVITASCACGNTFETGSIKSTLKVEICSACHPFYTGKQKFIDAGGRVDKFKKKYGI
jgi:large subunit ribosomal protein L31